MDLHVNLPLRTQEGRKVPTPRQNRAVKRTARPPVNLVSQCVAKTKKPGTFCSERWHVPLTGSFFTAAPLNLANSPMLHLLRPDEQALCSSLRILPKPYLVIKETLVREYARRGGKLRRREARDLVKIDVNKTSRVWDFLVQTGFLKIAPDLTANVNAQVGANSTNATNSGQPSG